MALADELKEVLNTNDFLVNTAQFSAFIYENFSDLNWAGFYFYRQGELRLGAFQGKVACSPIPLGKGVCGKAAKNRSSILVEDVHQFPGHIACDSASRAELVVPILLNDRLLGVFDLDSPAKARFSSSDQMKIEELVSVFVAQTDFSLITES